MIETVIAPVVPLAPGVRCFTTTRTGGCSVKRYRGLNLGMHVGDDVRVVKANRRLLQAHLGGLPIQWLEQVHGVALHLATPSQASRVPRADAALTSATQIALAVMTADCVPVVFAAVTGKHVAVAHAGWRGLAQGLLGIVLRAMPVPAEEVVAWIGPAIGQAHYEVGEEVASKFGSEMFKPSVNDNRWMLDLPGIAQLQLQQANVNHVQQCGVCTFTDRNLYSYRRDGITGRMATVAFREANSDS